MSKFTFTGDASGTLTKKLLTRAEKIDELAASGDERTEEELVQDNVIDAAGSEKMYEAERPQGADTSRSFDDNSIRKKEFFNALQMKGLRVCEDLELAPGKDIIFKKGQGDDEETFTARSIVKHIEMVYGYVDNSGDFHSVDHLKAVVEDADNLAELEPLSASGVDSNGDPLDTNSINESKVPMDIPQADEAGLASPTQNAHEEKWYLRIHLASGQILHREFEAVNDMLGQASDTESTLSVLGQMKGIESLQDAARQALLNEGAARVEQVESLESMIDTDFEKLVQHLSDMEAKLVAYIEARDSAVETFVLERMNELHDDIDKAKDSIKLHAAFDLTNIGQSKTVVLESDPLDIDTPANDGIEIEKWAIDVACFVTENGVVTRKDEFDADWEAEIVTDSDDKKLKITAEVVACDDSAPTEWVVNAVYCGDLKDDLLEHNRDDVAFVSPTLENIDLVIDGQSGSDEGENPRVQDTTTGLESD